MLSLTFPSHPCLAPHFRFSVTNPVIDYHQVHALSLFLSSCSHCLCPLDQNGVGILNETNPISEFLPYPSTPATFLQPTESSSNILFINQSILQVSKILSSPQLPKINVYPKLFKLYICKTPKKNVDNLSPTRVTFVAYKAKFA